MKSLKKIFSNILLKLNIYSMDKEETKEIKKGTMSFWSQSALFL